MPVKTPPVVRSATESDLLEIASLAKLVDRSAPANDEATVARHLSTYLSAGGRIFVALDQDGLDGYVLCRRVDPLFYAVDSSVIMDVVFVSPSQRRRGIGHALLLSVANFAREVEAGYVYSMPSGNDRPLHRFLASIGFAPLGGTRLVATPVLLRRLLRGPSSSGRPSRREDPITQGIAIRSKTRTPARPPIDEVIAKRKRALSATNASGG